MTGFRSTAKSLTKLWPGLEAGEPRAIHKARKLSRKAQAQLQIASAPKNTRRSWRRLRRALALVRDRDAAGQHLVEALMNLKVPAEVVNTFQAAWTVDRNRRFSEVTLPQPPPSVKRPKHWKARVQATLHRDAQQLAQEAVEVLGSGEVELWRKHLKRYRYTLELSGDAPTSLLHVLEHLGRMQDAQVTQELLTQEDWLPQYRDALLYREKEAQGQAQARVRELWPALAEHLKSPAQDGSS